MLLSMPLNAVKTRSQSLKPLNFEKLTKICTTNNKKLLELLFEANIGAREFFYELVDHCIENGNMKCLRYLLAHTPVPLTHCPELLIDWSTHTPNHCTALKILLEKRTNWTALAPDGLVLHEAAQVPCVSCIQNLLLYGADPCWVDRKGKTAQGVANESMMWTQYQSRLDASTRTDLKEKYLLCIMLLQNNTEELDQSDADEFSSNTDSEENESSSRDTNYSATEDEDEDEESSSSDYASGELS